MGGGTWGFRDLRHQLRGSPEALSRPPPLTTLLLPCTPQEGPQRAGLSCIPGRQPAQAVGTAGGGCAGQHPLLYFLVV